ncbi:MAG: DUF1080 domain-containing protein [Planctomycetota bacterium]
MVSAERIGKRHATLGGRSATFATVAPTLRRRATTIDPFRSMKSFHSVPFVLVAACAAPPAPQPLFDGKSLDGWHADVPAADKDPNLPPSFVVRDGLLISLGKPEGHLVTDRSFHDYRLTVEYRWTGEPGNCGILVHASTPRRLYGMFPQSIECQMHAGNAGDFWCIGEDIAVPDMETRRGPRAEWGVDGNKRRRILNLTDGSEKPPGEWNRMVIECRGREIDVWVNDDHVNHGFDCSADHGAIAIQAEGAECAFRKVELLPLAP